MRTLILTLLFVGCAHNQLPAKRSVVDEINEENISVQSVLDLARTSYLKGCVDSKNYWHPQKGVKAFPKCKEMAKLHEKDINAIINNNASPAVLKKQLKNRQ